MSFSDLIQNTINKHTGGGDNNNNNSNNSYSSNQGGYSNEGGYSGGNSNYNNMPSGGNYGGGPGSGYGGPPQHHSSGGYGSHEGGGYSAGGSANFNTPSGGNGNYGGGNYNSGPGSGYGGPQHGSSGGYGHGQGQSGYGSDDEFSSAASHAQAHKNEDSSLFNTALSFIKDRKNQSQQDDIDESHMVQSHQALYGGGSDERRAHDSNSLGAGAAMQALKMFTGGGGSSSGSGSGDSSGGMDKNKLIGIAMAQASKLWDEKNASGGGVTEDKQSAVNKAAEMALKMYMKGQGSGSSGTGGPGGGLMSLASKFLK